MALRDRHLRVVGSLSAPVLNVGTMRRVVFVRRRNVRKVPYIGLFPRVLSMLHTVDVLPAVVVPRAVLPHAGMCHPGSGNQHRRRAMINLQT